ncbi:hypothetical protein LTR36_006226 [Oleoguttula mirabilis]|uniref:Uncharacterized protein n=1 Tax=Oleoguttula mirabilis TaxID=1507867 RepID=A0AAV9JCI4_9PEZI|nr:hypothetical protein LTR36_006226 [Oleoguttula mirabilis]
MAAMGPPPAFRFPPTKDSQPLHTLSPERVNATRPLSSLSTTTNATKTTMTSDAESQFRRPHEISSTHSSPTRKVNLFADFHPTTPTSTRGFALPQSPSLPEIHALRGHARTNSDVQGLVKRFEHLDVRDKDAESAERLKRHEAELGRAQIAREEAESDVKRLRHEMRGMRKDAEESRERESKVVRRLETVMDEYANAKENYASQHAIYEKELRKARKEAFKSSSVVLKLQEELKSTRSSLRITQSGFELEKEKVQRREQETFNAQYQLAAVQEELDKLRAHLRIAQEEKEALKTSLKEEEVARMAAEGMIALPPSKEEEDVELFGSSRRSSPQKRARSPLSDDKENMGALSKKMLEAKRLQEELLREQTRREHAEDMIEFLSLECRFRCCSCQTAAKRGHDYGVSISGELAATLDHLMEGVKNVLHPSGGPDVSDQMQVDSEAVMEEMPEAEPASHTNIEEMASSEEPAEAPERTPETHEPEDDDRSVTLAAEEPSPEQQLPIEEDAPTAPHPAPAEPEAERVVAEDRESNHAEEMPENSTTVPLPASSPELPLLQQQTAPLRPHHHNIRTVTTTTTVPMHFTPIGYKTHLHQLPFDDAENIPPLHFDSTSGATAPTFDRAAALAAIEYRRGRAKSIATGHMTPRKQMLEGVNMKERRDISAPALGGKTIGGGSFAKGASSVGRAGGRRMA